MRKLEALRQGNKDRDIRWSLLSPTAVLPHDEKELKDQLEAKLRYKIEDHFYCI